MRDVLIPTDLIFPLSSRQGATCSGKTLPPSHLFAPLVQVWVGQTHETNWFCSVDTAGLQSWQSTVNPFAPAAPQPLPSQLGTGTGSLAGQGHGWECVHSSAVQPLETPCALRLSLQNAHSLNMSTQKELHGSSASESLAN